MKRTASRTLGSLIYIGSVWASFLSLPNLAQGAVVYVPLPEDSSWLHVIENDDSTISSRLDFDGDGIGDLMIASDFSGVALFTGRNVRLLVVGGVTSNAAEGRLLDGTPLIVGVGTWLSGNDVERFLSPELGLLPLKREIALSGLGSLPFTKFGRGGGYVGIETTGPDGIHYGWLHIENDNPQWLTGGRVTGYAYESTPGKPITTGSIPEPSVLLITSTVIFAFLFRRRRASEQA